LPSRRIDSRILRMVSTVSISPSPSFCPIAGRLESRRGVGQNWMPIGLKGGSLLHADSQLDLKTILKPWYGIGKTLLGPPPEVEDL
jgi:hypothetical protein